MIWDALSYLSYWSSTAPLLVCAVLWCLRRNPTEEAWLLSAAFFVSFIADSLGAVLALRGINNWWLSYAFAPLQFGLLIWTVAEQRPVRNVALIGLLLLAAVSAVRGTLDAPETFVKVIGGAVVAVLVLEGPMVRRYRGPVLLYCLGAIPWLLAMGAIPRERPLWLYVWVGYLVTRIVALGWMVQVVNTPVLTVEVRHGPGEHQVPGERRTRRDGACRGASRGAVAARQR